jgi:hypothetical protein
MATITATLSNGTQLVNAEIDSTWFDENEGVAFTNIESLIISGIEVKSIFASTANVQKAIEFLEEENHDCDSEVYIAYLLLERDGSDNDINVYSSDARNNADLNFDLPLEEAKIKFAENKIYDLLAEIKNNIEQSQYDAIKYSMSPSKYAEKLFDEDYLIIEVEGTSYVFKRD